MCIDIYIYIYTCIYTYMYRYVYIYIYMCYVYIYIDIHIDLHMYNIYIYIYVLLAVADASSAVASSLYLVMSRKIVLRMIIASARSPMHAGRADVRETTRWSGMRMRGGQNTVGNLVELLGLKKAYRGLQFTGTCVNNREYGFIEFEISNNTISTVFRQPHRPV